MASTTSVSQEQKPPNFFYCNSGEGEIRTPGGVNLTRIPTERTRPLCDLSAAEAEGFEPPGPSGLARFQVGGLTVRQRLQKSRHGLTSRFSEVSPFGAAERAGIEPAHLLRDGRLSRAVAYQLAHLSVMSNA